MNNEIENQIMIVLLNKPELLRTIHLDADWFIDHNFRELITAMDNLELEQSDTPKLWATANFADEKFAMSLADLNQMRNQFSTDANLSSDVKSLHKLAAQRNVNIAIKEFSQNPYEDNGTSLSQALNELNNIDTGTDDGNLSETTEDLVFKLNHKMPTGIRTYKQLDDKLAGGLYGSMLLTIGARPSMGKTAYAVNLAYEIMKNDADVQVDYFTLEMSKKEMLNRFISRDTGFMTQDLRNPAERLNDIQKRMVTQSVDWINEVNLNVYDHLPNLDGIIGTIRKNAMKANPNKYVAIIDYIGLISVPGIKERREQIEKITRELKIATNKFDIPIVALAQLNRGIESRTDKTPQLSDLRDSGSIEQDSNVVAFLHRPFEKVKDSEQLLIQKNREGTLGKIDYYFNGAEMLFKEQEKPKK